MNTRQDMLAMPRHKAMALACLLSICMGLVLIWGQYVHAQSVEKATELFEIQLFHRDIHHNSGQIHQLHQLTQDLAALKGSSQLKIQSLQTTHHRVRWAYTVTEVTVCLALGGLIWMWCAHHISAHNTTPKLPSYSAVYKANPSVKTSVMSTLPKPLTRIVSPEVGSSSPQETDAPQTFDSILVELTPLNVGLPEFPDICSAFYSLQGLRWLLTSGKPPTDHERSQPRSHAPTSHPTVS